MDHTSVVETIISAIAAVCENKGMRVPALTAATALDASLGLKSLDYAELVVRLEDELGHDPFAQGAIPSIQTVGDLAALYADS